MTEAGYEPTQELASTPVHGVPVLVLTGDLLLADQLHRLGAAAGVDVDVRSEPPTAGSQLARPSPGSRSVPHTKHPGNGWPCSPGYRSAAARASA